MTREQAYEAACPAVAVVPAGLGVLAVEYNGFQGSRPEVIRQLAATGTAASIYWHVNTMVRLTYARNGRLLGDDELRGLECERFLPKALIPDLAHAETAGHDMVLAGMDAVARPPASRLRTGR